MGFQVAYIPIGVPTYHLETAREQFEQSKAMLSSISSKNWGYLESKFRI